MLALKVSRTTIPILINSTSGRYFSFVNNAHTLGSSWNYTISQGVLDGLILQVPFGFENVWQQADNGYTQITVQSKTPL